MKTLLSWALALLLLPTLAAAQNLTAGPVTPGVVAAKSDLVGCQYNTAAPSLSNGQQAAVQCGSDGRISVRVLPPAAGAFTAPGCTVGASSAQCLAGALAVNSLTLQNESATAQVACSIGGTAVLNDKASFMLLPAQSRSWNITTGGVPSAAINCIATSASTPLYVEYN